MKILPTILLLSLLCYSCKEEKSEPGHSIHVTGIVDLTDTVTIQPDADAILKLYGFDADNKNEATFKIESLTDKRLNPDKEIHLADASVTEKDNIQDDPNYRDKLVLSFYQSIRKLITDYTTANKGDTSLDNSECFRTIVNELKLMEEHKGDVNELLVFSDLQENSDLFDCYSKENQELLQKKPGQVTALFEATKLLPENLKGFTIIFIYNPPTRLADQKFGTMTDIYKKLLESRGAIIKVKASNNNLN